MRSLCGSPGSQTSSIDPGTPFSVAVNLNSPSEDCSYARPAGTSHDIFMLNCLLCNLPLTTLDNSGRHSNESQVHRRQFSVHTMQRLKGSLHYACIHTNMHINRHTHIHSRVLCHQLHIVQLLYLLVYESLTSSGPHCTSMFYVSVSLALCTVI